MRNWLVVRSLGWAGNSIMHFNTKPEAEAFAAEHGGKVMSHQEYEWSRM